MRTSAFTPEQMVLALRQAEAGTPTEAVCRKLGISDATFHRWRKGFGTLGTPEVRELRPLREENRRLRSVVTDLTLDRSTRSLSERNVRPAERRMVVSWAEEAYRVSERRACRVFGVERSSVRYRSVRSDQAPLRRRLRKLASVRVRAGYRMLHVLLRREGWPVNHKRICCLYSEEGVPLKRQRRRRHRSAVVRVERPVVTGVDQ
jgi:putative transposase